MPSTNCQSRPSGPIQSERAPIIRISRAAPLPSSIGTPKASPAVTPGFPAPAPSRLQVQLDPGDEDEQHHRPPGDPVQRGDDIGREHEAIGVGIHGAQHAGAEHDAAEDLHHHQRREIIGPPQPPDQPRQAENDDQRQQEQFGGGDGDGHRRLIARGSVELTRKRIPFAFIPLVAPRIRATLAIWLSMQSLPCSSTSR